MVLRFDNFSFYSFLFINLFGIIYLAYVYVELSKYLSNYVFSSSQHVNIEIIYTQKKRSELYFYFKK